MFTLRLLGGLHLESEAGAPGSRGTQRRRLALLALLALASGRRMSRERLISILWPESSESEGRARLSSALYDMRQVLGDHALVGQGDELRLELSALRVDVEDFQAAVRRQDWQQAAALYRGPLLDGVALDSRDFEEWLDGHRDRFFREYVHVLERLERWSELAALEPLSARWTLQVMKVQADADDRAGAIRTGERFQARLREEMSLAPDPVVASRLAQLRKAPAPPEPRREQPPTQVEPEARIAPPAARSQSVPRSRGMRAAALGIGLLVLGFAGWQAARLTFAGAPRDASLRVAVFPFKVSGDSSLAFLEDGLVDLLSADMEGLGAFSSVDPHALLALARRSPSVPSRELARLLHADRFVVGTVFGRGDSIQIRALMYEVAGEKLIREARATGLPATVPSLVDRITAEFIAGELGGGGNRIASVGAQTTLSIPALREFLAGEAAFRRGRFAVASAAYRRAVGLDSTFALAHYRLALAILWGNQQRAETALHDSLALRHGDRLSPRDRDLVHAYAAWRSGRGQEAWRRYSAIVARYPDDVEAWFQRGESEFHYGPVMGTPIVESRVSFHRVVALDPEHWGARWHLALLDAGEGRVRALRDRALELLALEPDSATALEIQLVAGIGPGGGAPPPAARAGELEVFGAAWRRAVYLRDLEGARELYTGLLESGRSPYARHLGLGGLGELALAQGRWAEALQNWESIPSTSRFELQVAAAILPGFERPVSEREDVQDRLTRWMAGQGGLLVEFPGEGNGALLVAALLAAARGDTGSALALARRLDSVVDPASPSYTATGRVVRAYLAYRGGRPADALDLLGSGAPNRWYGHTLTSAGEGRSFERFLRAELLRQLGRPEEALRWYAGFGENAVYDLAFLAPALLRSAELNLQLDRPSVATEQLGRAAALWKRADPEYRTMLERQVSPVPAAR